LFTVVRQAAKRSGRHLCGDGWQAGGGGATSQLPVVQLLPPADVREARYGVMGGSDRQGEWRFNGDETQHGQLASC